MRLSEFWRRMDARFGATYSRTLAREYLLPTLRTTVEQALHDGVPAKEVWRAICAEFEMPQRLR